MDYLKFYDASSSNPSDAVPEPLPPDESEEEEEQSFPVVPPYSTE